MSGAQGDGGSVTALAEAARATWVAGNRADGERLRACYALFRACQRADSSGVDEGVRPGYAVVDPFDVCSNHLVAQFAISTGRADRMIGLSVDLTERYPRVLDALLQGRLDQRAAELLARQMHTVDDAVVDRVQREAVDEYLAAIEAGRRLGDKAIRDMIDQAIARHDADGIGLRREDAARERGVRISKGHDGMSTLWAHLAADELAVVAEHLDRRVAAFAEAATEAEAEAEAADLSGRSLAEQRADALMALICGEPVGSPLAHRASHPPEGAGASLRPKVTVIAGPDGAEPAVQFPRTGDSSIRALVAMLGTADGASIESIDPTIGAHDDPSRFQTYRPSAALARAIRLRDGTCRHPGCTVPAELGDIDHVIPFDHGDPTAGGQTREDNHCILCRAHHRFKTFSDWRYSMAPDGTLTIKAPDGTTMHTTPTGPLAAYRRREQAEEHSRWDRQQRRAPDTRPGADPPAEPTYWHRRAARARAERRIAARAHQAARERAQRQATAAPTPGATDQNAADQNATVSVIETRLHDLLHPPPF